MTTITDLCRGTRRTGGYTLTEVMIAMAIASLVGSALFASWGFIARSTVAIAHYTEMNTIARHGLETFARDIRMARGVGDFSESGVTLIMDDDGDEVIR